MKDSIEGITSTSSAAPPQSGYELLTRLRQMGVEVDPDLQTQLMTDTDESVARQDLLAAGVDAGTVQQAETTPLPFEQVFRADKFDVDKPDDTDRDKGDSAPDVGSWMKRGTGATDPKSNDPNTRNDPNRNDPNNKYDPTGKPVVNGQGNSGTPGSNLPKNEPNAQGATGTEKTPAAQTPASEARSQDDQKDNDKQTDARGTRPDGQAQTPQNALNANSPQTGTNTPQTATPQSNTPQGPPTTTGNMTQGGAGSNNQSNSVAVARTGGGPSSGALPSQGAIVNQPMVEAYIPPPQGESAETKAAQQTEEQAKKAADEEAHKKQFQKADSQDPRTMTNASLLKADIKEEPVKPPIQEAPVEQQLAAEEEEQAAANPDQQNQMQDWLSGAGAQAIAEAAPKPKPKTPTVAQSSDNDDEEGAHGGDLSSVDRPTSVSSMLNLRPLARMNRGNESEMSGQGHADGQEEFRLPEGLSSEQQVEVQTWYAGLSESDREGASRFLSGVPGGDQERALNLMRKVDASNVSDPQQRDALRTVVLNGAMRLTDDEADFLNKIVLTDPSHINDAQAENGFDGQFGNTASYNSDNRTLLVSTNLLGGTDANQTEVMSHEMAHVHQGYEMSTEASGAESRGIALGSGIERSYDAMAVDPGRRQASQSVFERFYLSNGDSAGDASRKAANAVGLDVTQQGANGRQEQLAEYYASSRAMYQNGTAAQRAELQLANPEMYALLESEERGGLATNASLASEARGAGDRLGMSSTNVLQMSFMNPAQRAQWLADQTGVSDQYRAGVQYSVQGGTTDLTAEADPQQAGADPNPAGQAVENPTTVESYQALYAANLAVQMDAPPEELDEEAPSSGRFAPGEASKNVNDVIGKALQERINATDFRTLGRAARSREGATQAADSFEWLISQEGGEDRMIEVFHQASKTRSIANMSMTLANMARANPDKTLGLLLLTTDAEGGTESLIRFFGSMGNNKQASPHFANFMDRVTRSRRATNSMSEFLDTMTSSDNEGPGARVMARLMSSASTKPADATRLMAGLERSARAEGGGRTISQLLHRMSQSNGGARDVANFLDNLSHNHASMVKTARLLSRAASSSAGAGQVLDTLNRIANQNGGEDRVSDLLSRVLDKPDGGKMLVNLATGRNANKLANLLDAAAATPQGKAAMQEVFENMQGTSDMSKFMQKVNGSAVLREVFEDLMSPVPGAEEAGAEEIKAEEVSNTGQLPHLRPTYSLGSTQSTRRTEETEGAEVADGADATDKGGPTKFRPADVYSESTLKAARICGECGFRLTNTGECLRCSEETWRRTGANRASSQIRNVNDISGI